MKYYLLVISFLLTLLPLTLPGQWMEDFSSGDLGQGTSWMGNTDHFTITADKKLQLLAPQAGTSVLYTEQFIPDSARWDFFIDLDFSPSNTNQVRLILFADQSDLNEANGYYLEAGETGSGDALKLIRVTAGQKTVLASGTPGAMGGSTATVRGRVERQADGLWTLFADYTGGFTLNEEFAITDITHLPQGPGIFGVICIYTSTRTDKFFFDDFAIKPLLPDLQPPQLIDVAIIDEYELQLRFDESLDGNEAINPERYFLNNGFDFPALAEWFSSDPSAVNLRWTTPMVNFIEYSLRVEGLQDLSGNTIDTFSYPFTFFLPKQPNPGDILINEIMADPSPQASLPEQEFLELYNASSEVLDLGGLQIQTSSSQTLLPSYILFPNQYIILTLPANEGLFLPYGNVLGVPGLPVLPNTGTILTLRSKDGVALHTIPYSDQWHTTTTKRDGGWSLELIAPGELCAITGRWSSSIDPSGGTPGRNNSIFDAFEDTNGPLFLRVWPNNPHQIKATFNEQLTRDLSADMFLIEPTIGIDSVTTTEEANVVLIHLSQPIVAGTIYSVRPQSNLTDCLGNAYTENRFLRVALPEKPVTGDLLINEILFNPPTGGQDFVEIYNQTSKVFSLQDLLLANMQPGREETRPIGLEALIFPEEHQVFTSDTAFLRSYWPNAEQSLVFSVSTPAWLNEDGNVTLFYNDGADLILLDQMDYREDMHFTLLRDVKGVSLERLSYDLSGTDQGNWKSGAEEVGYATPTRRNSQALDQLIEKESPFSLQTERFSPDGDGYQDLMVINYTLEAPGFVLNAKVFDRQGRFVQDLANTQLLGTEGLITWDGTTGDAQLARPGPYIIWLEIFNLQGKVLKDKLPVMLVLPLE
jgi:hypothetical protein